MKKQKTQKLATHSPGTINVPIPKELHKRLKIVAVYSDNTISALVSAAVERYLDSTIPRPSKITA